MTRWLSVAAVAFLAGCQQPEVPTLRTGLGQAPTRFEQDTPAYVEPTGATRPAFLWHAVGKP